MSNANVEATLPTMFKDKNEVLLFLLSVKVFEKKIAQLTLYLVQSVRG